MDQVLAMMLLLTCPDSMQGCTRLPELVSSYSSFEACEADFPRAMGLASRISPLVIAKCLPVDASVQGTPSLVWSIDADNLLTTSIIYTDVAQPQEEQEVTMNDAEVMKSGRLR